MIGKQGLNSEQVILSPIIEKYVVAKRFQGEEAREIHREVVEKAKSFKSAEGNGAYFKFNEETGEINGLNLFYGVLINDSLRRKGLWIPTIRQAKQLDLLGKLTNGVYRDYGFAVYNGENPNSELAKKLLDESKRRGWRVPILAPFKTLKLDENGKVSFSEDTREIMTGEEADAYLNKHFAYRTNSGVRRLSRGRYGDWGALWDYLAYSSEDGRVDWICGEATTQNLEGTVLDEIDKIGEDKLEEIRFKIEKLKKVAIETLRS